MTSFALHKTAVTLHQKAARHIVSILLQIHGWKRHIGTIGIDLEPGRLGSATAVVGIVGGQLLLKVLEHERQVEAGARKPELSNLRMN